MGEREFVYHKIHYRNFVRLLTQNSELKPHHIYNFAIPAWFVRLDGKVFKTCPNAGACAQVCYARNGTYLFSNVLAAHTRNLRLTLEQPDEFRDAIKTELSHKRFNPKYTPRVMPDDAKLTDDQWLVDWIAIGGAAVRIHDSGDFYSEAYLQLWFAIATDNPHILFYAYTKEVEMLKNHAVEAPINFRWLYSTGGLQDHLITDNDRQADVFPNEQAIVDAGYESQDATDLLAVLLKTNFIGIPANNIKHFNRKMAGKRFSEL
jgi:hypothetical protein